MLEYGKSLFKSNVTQLFFLFFCFGLGILAKGFSIETSSLSLHDFVSFSLNNLFSDTESYGIGLNVIVPFIFYFVAAALLAWISFSNFTTFQFEGNKLNMALKLILASCEGILAVWFLISGGKLAFYFFAFVLTLLVLIGLIILAITAKNDEY